MKFIDALAVKYGRRFAIAITGAYMAMAALVLSLLVMALVPAVADSVSSAMFYFSIIMSMCVGAYMGANTYTDKLIGMGPRTTQTTVKKEETTVNTQAGTTTAIPPRPSGSVIEPPAESSEADGNRG